MYEIEFLELGKSEKLNGFGKVIQAVRAAYPNAAGRRCPDGGYMFWRDSLDMLLFDSREDYESGGGMAIAEVTARK